MKIAKHEGTPISDKGEGEWISLNSIVTEGSEGEFREFVALLFAASSRLQSMRRELSGALKLSAAEFGVLVAVRFLERQSTVRVRDIAEHLRLTAAHVTTIVGRLEKSGWVTKELNGNDNRSVSVRVSPAAQRRVDRLSPILRAINDEWFAGMTRDEFVVVGNFLRRFIAQYELAYLRAKEANIRE